MNVLAIAREKRFSPNSVEKDRAILEAVALRLRQNGHTVTIVEEPNLPYKEPDAVISMGRLPETLARLKAWTKARIINRPEGVEACDRKNLERLMAENHVPAPPCEGNHGYWLKRADACAQSKADVVYCADAEALAQEKQRFARRGITSYTVSAHVVGDLVKFYGAISFDNLTISQFHNLSDTDQLSNSEIVKLSNKQWFRFFYPADDGQSKFGDERRNGAAHHYAFSETELAAAANRLALAAHLSVYGGDAIIRPDGTFCIIDFNDWPSFSRCKDEAAEAIANKLKNDGKKF